MRCWDSTNINCPGNMVGATSFPLLSIWLTELIRPTLRLTLRNSHIGSATLDKTKASASRLDKIWYHLLPASSSSTADPPPITQIICIGHMSVNPCLWRCFLLGNLLRALLMLPQSSPRVPSDLGLTGSASTPWNKAATACKKSPKSAKLKRSGSRFWFVCLPCCFFADEHHIEPSTSARKPKFLAISHDLLALIAKILHGVYEQ